MCSVAIVLPSNENDVFQYPNVTMTMVEELVRMGDLDVRGNVYLDNRWAGKVRPRMKRRGEWGYGRKGQRGWGGKGKGKGGG